MSRFDSYRLIEEYRKRPMVVYATSTRPGVVASMADDAVREFVDQVDRIDRAETAVDILLHSTGGDPLAAWKIMSVLRERFDNVAVLVPYKAFSAATLFALGADEIVMHPHASLGPIDPQITVNDGGKEMHFGYEDVNAFIRFITDDIKLSDQSFTSEMAKKLCDIANPLVIGYAKRASGLSEEVGARMLRLHMSDSDGDRNRAAKIARDLNRGFFAHGDAVSRSRARELHLKVAADNLQLEGLVWGAYRDIEDHLQLREPFNPFDLFMSDPTAANTLAAVQALPIPANAPPPVLNAVWNQVANDLVQARHTIPEVPFTLTHAIVESIRHSTAFQSAGTVIAIRLPDGTVNTSVTTRKGCWVSSTPTLKT